MHANVLARLGTVRYVLRILKPGEIRDGTRTGKSDERKQAWRHVTKLAENLHKGLMLQETQKRKRIGH